MKMFHKSIVISAAEYYINNETLRYSYITQEEITLHEKNRCFVKCFYLIMDSITISREKIPCASTHYVTENVSGRSSVP